MRIWSLLLFAAILSGCRNESPEEKLRKLPRTETSNGTEGVGTAERSVPKVAWGVSFQQSGLEVEEAVIVDMAGKSLDAKIAVNGKDSILIHPLIRGWKLVGGKAIAGVSGTMKSPDGKVISELKDLFKEVTRFPIDSGEGPAIMVTAAGLDTTVPYYDCEFRIWDNVSGRSVSGSYRLHLK